MADWMTLREYANKYQISVSTLRRRIKGEEIEYVFENGRYLIQSPREGDLETQDKETLCRLLEERESHIIELEKEREDMIGLLDFLEGEKARLERICGETAPFPPP